MINTKQPAGHVFYVQSSSVSDVLYRFESSNSIYLQKPDQMKQKIAEILEECSSKNWDSEGAAAVTAMTAAIAENLVDCLPITLDQPSLFPMRNGKIAFQWVSKEKSAFLLSVDEQGRITYSVVLKDGERKNGSKVFLGTLPNDVREPLLRAAI